MVHDLRPNTVQLHASCYTGNGITEQELTHTNYQRSSFQRYPRGQSEVSNWA